MCAWAPVCTGLVRACVLGCGCVGHTVNSCMDTPLTPLPRAHWPRRVRAGGWQKNKPGGRHTSLGSLHAFPRAFLSLRSSATSNTIHFLPLPRSLSFLPPLTPFQNLPGVLPCGFSSPWQRGPEPALLRTPCFLCGGCEPTLLPSSCGDHRHPCGTRLPSAPRGPWCPEPSLCRLGL